MLNVHPLIFIQFPSVLHLSLLLGHGGRREGEMWQVVSISLPEEAWTWSFNVFIRLLGQLCTWLLLHWSQNKTNKQKGAFYIMLDTCFFSLTPKTSLSRARFLVLQLTTGEFAAPPSLCPIFCHPQVLLYVLSCAAPSRGLCYLLYGNCVCTIQRYVYAKQVKQVN